MTENVTLSPRQESAIAAILAHGVLTRAAEATGVSLRQLHRWLEIPAFQAELRKQQDELRSGTVRRLQVCMLGAVDVLANVMVDTSQNAGVRISAAAKLLDAALKAAELHDLAQRVAELEYSVKLAQREVEAFENAIPDDNGITIIDYRRGLKAPDGYQHT